LKPRETQGKQDCYDIDDDDEDACSNDAPSTADYFDAPADASDIKASECKLDMEPSMRLINALENLREVITENTKTHTTVKRRPGAGGQTRKQETQKGPDGVPKDDRLKVRKEKVIVELRVVFLKIGEIDTLKEQYSADTFIQAKWREPHLDGKSPEDLKGVDLDKFWNPLLYIDNILAETKEATWQTASMDRGQAFIMERRRVRGIFMENLELNDFPLDVQDLTVTITSERPDTEIDIIPDENEMSAINLSSFVDQQEWKLHEHIEVSRKVMTQEYSSSNRCHPALSVTCRAARRPGYFYWNVFLVMFFITALSFSTFSVSPELPQNRLQLSLTLLLTCVAFKFVINKMIPPVSYLTYMDKYVLLSLVILCVVCIWHAVVTVFTQCECVTELCTSRRMVCKFLHGSRFLAELERDVFVAFLCVYIICHLVFIFWLYFDACKRRRLMKSKDKEYLIAKKAQIKAKLARAQQLALNASSGSECN